VPSGHHVAFFADEPGGVFNESFPAVHPFPARALLVPLQGRLAVDVYEGTSASGPKGRSGGADDAVATEPTSTTKPPRRARKEGRRMAVTTVLSPPVWHDHLDVQQQLQHGEENQQEEEQEERMVATSAPVDVPFGGAHAVRTLDGGTACWAYVFGERPA
jgi:hypothetical protein